PRRPRCPSAVLRPLPPASPLFPYTTALPISHVSGLGGVRAGEEPADPRPQLRRGEHREQHPGTAQRRREVVGGGHGGPAFVRVVASSLACSDRLAAGAAGCPGRSSHGGVTR